MAKAKREPTAPLVHVPDHGKLAATLGGTGGLAANATLIKAGQTKHGPRQNWRASEYTQAAIAALYPLGGVPKNVDRSKLTKRVNKWLTEQPDWCATGLNEISRYTVIRELKRLLSS